MFRTGFLIAIVFLVRFGIYGQTNVKSYVFEPGESVSYDVYYNLGFFWFKAAKAEFTVQATKHNGKAAFHFYGNGQTLPNYDWIFKVRDYFESIADATTLNPVYYKRNTLEGGYTVNNEYVFNYADSNIYSSINNSKTDRFSDTLKIIGRVYDPLTAIYASRNFDISNIQKGDTIPIKMLVDNEVHELYLRYLGVDDTEISEGVTFSCKKFSILMIEGTIFSGGENITLWISDDYARIPIRVEAKILVGSIVAKISKVNGNSRYLKQLKINSNTNY